MENNTLNLMHLLKRMIMTVKKDYESLLKGVIN